PPTRSRSRKKSSKSAACSARWFRSLEPRAYRLQPSHPMAKPASKLSHDQLVFVYALLAGLPAVITAECFLWFGDNQPKLHWTLTLLIVCFWFGFAGALRGRVVRPLQTMANLLSALREGD